MWGLNTTHQSFWKKLRILGPNCRLWSQTELGLYPAMSSDMVQIRQLTLSFWPSFPCLLQWRPQKCTMMFTSAWHSAQDLVSTQRLRGIIICFAQELFSVCLWKERFLYLNLYLKFNWIYFNSRIVNGRHHINTSFWCIVQCLDNSICYSALITVSVLFLSFTCITTRHRHPLPP